MKFYRTIGSVYCWHINSLNYKSNLDKHYNWSRANHRVCIYIYELGVLIPLMVCLETLSICLWLLRFDEFWHRVVARWRGNRVLFFIINLAYLRTIDTAWLCSSGCIRLFSFFRNLHTMYVAFRYCLLIDIFYGMMIMMLMMTDCRLIWMSWSLQGFSN